MPEGKKESEVSFVPKQVIENALLAALDDKEKVAIVLDEEDLKRVIYALRGTVGKVNKTLADDMQTLFDKAFR